MKHYSFQPMWFKSLPRVASQNACWGWAELYNVVCCLKSLLLKKYIYLHNLVICTTDLRKMFPPLRRCFLDEGLHTLDWEGKPKRMNITGSYHRSHAHLLPLKEERRTSLVVQWLGIHLPTQGTQVRSLVWKIPLAVGQLSLCATTTEPRL